MTEPRCHSYSRQPAGQTDAGAIDLVPLARLVVLLCRQD